MQDGMAQARVALESGAAKARLQQLISITQTLAG